VGLITDGKFKVKSLLQRLITYKNILKFNVFSQCESNTLARINHAIDNLRTDVSDGSLRRQPFCIVLYGFPGTGKSSFAIQIARALMYDLYGGFQSTDMVTLNETDEYQSEFRSSHKVVLFDDIGASKYGLNDTKNPWRKVIDFVNNIKKTALNPNVEMKGKVYIQPDLVIITSNLNFAKGAFINLYIPAAEAILRRLSCIVKVNDHDSVTPLLPVRNKISTSDSAYLSNALEYRLQGGSTSPEILSRDKYIQSLRVKFRDHMIDQSNFINHFNSYFDDHIDLHELEFNEILDPQSGFFDIRANLYSETCSQYYLTHVNWERYIIEYDTCLLTTDAYLSTCGIVDHTRNSSEDLFIDIDIFNEVLMNKFPGVFVGHSHLTSSIDEIFAESKDEISIQMDTNKNIDLNDNLVISDDIDSLIDRMNLYADTGNHSTQLSVLPSPYCNIIKYASNSVLMERSYFLGWALYIIDKLGKDISWLRKLSSFNSAITHHLGLANNQLNSFYSHLNTFNDKFHLDYPLGKIESIVIKKIDESQSNTNHSCSSNDSSLSTYMWDDEKSQIRFVSNLISCSAEFQIYTNLKFSTFGEIDLLCEAPRSILVLELKSGSTGKNKGRQQVIRYSRVMSAFRPKKRIIGLTHRKYGFQVVCDLKSSIKSEFNGFLQTIGYINPQPVIIE
jgi:hypothetical protein